MKIGKVIGTVWATRKDEKLSGLKLLVIQPVNIMDGSTEQAPVIAADIIGAGKGETVLLVSGSSARSAAGAMDIPVDATVVGIIDDKEINMNCL